MSTKNLLLFGITLIDEIMREFRDPGGFVSFSYKNLYGFVPPTYKRKNLYGMVNNLKISGKVLSTMRGSFKITEKGKRDILVNFPNLQFLHKPWDGKWRIVGFDIEEKKRSLRNALRRSLYMLGFGMLQESLYVSPLPIENTVEKILSSNRNEIDNAYIFVSDKFFLGNAGDFVNRAFHITDLNNAYGELLTKLVLEKEGEGKLLQEFIKVSVLDPFLPKELLPKDFVRERLWREFRERRIIR